jgi:hypothetical protein
MSMNLGKTNVAFAKLLEMAGGRYDDVEWALVEASRRLAGGNAPSYAQVVQVLKERQRGSKAGSKASSEMAFSPM